MNILTYAGCIHRFDINENGYVQIDIFGYDSNAEKFINVIDKPLIPSMIMKYSKCFIVGSCLIDKGLCVLLQLITSNSSILMFIQLQSRPWLCHILYTLSNPILNYGSMKFLSINSFLSIFINEDKKSNGFYIIDNKKEKYEKNIEFISCSLLTYIYCYLKNNYYWLMGNEIDFNTKQKLIKVYYGCSSTALTPLIEFNTHKFIPLSFIDNIQDIYILNHKFELKSRLIVGDVIISSRDKRILTCHNGTISYEISMNNLITSIYYYQTIENDKIFLFHNKTNQTIEIFQKSNENFILIPYTNKHEIADLILIDDFTHIGWKQILFLKNSSHFNSFILTDFSQIYIFQQESNYEYNTEEKRLSMEIDDNDDDEIQTSLILVQNILRKKIINADFIINEGYFQCKEIEDNIRKISNKYHIQDLSIQTDNLTQNLSIIQLIDMNWFIYQTNLYLYTTIKNISNNTLTLIHLFGIDKHSNKIKFFHLKLSSQSSINEQMIFSLNSQSILTFTLRTLIELDKDIDINLYLLINDNKLFHVGSIIITIDDLINRNNQRILKINSLENESNNLMFQQALIYLNNLFRLNLNIESKSKFDLIEKFHQLLSTIGFKKLFHLSNIYIRINEGNIFEHIFIHLVNEDDFLTDNLIVHFYAKNSNETTMIAKYILSKLDFQSISIIDSKTVLSEQENTKILNRIQIELTSYIDLLKQIPTIMRKLTSTSKSETYRLLKLENFQLFQNERYITDLLLSSSFIID